MALTLAACSNDSGGSTDEGSSSGGTTSAAPTGSETGAPATTTGASAPTTGAASSDTTEAPATGTTGAEATSGEATSGETTSGEATDGGSETTAAAPTDGPGVLPGEEGLEAMCRRYVECGGTYYADQQGCLDATYDYWGDCPSRKAALDAFGACMSELECSDWSPDAYNPANTPCAAQWGDVQDSEACG